MEYIAIRLSDGHYQRFSSKGEVADWVEGQINDYGKTIANFLVFSGEHIEGLMVEAQKTVRVSIGEC